MTRWMHPPERGPRDHHDRFDPVVEGERFGLAQHRARVLWQRACADATDPRGWLDAALAAQRFHALARAAEQARASRHTPGRATLIERSDAPESSPPALESSPPAREPSPPVHATSPRALASLPARLPGATIHRLFAGPAQRGATAQARTVAASAGQPLDGATRTWAEAAFGYDFGGVAVHTSSDAAQAAEALGARAFTLGNSIVFGQGHYDPSSPAGRKLLAHELTHIVQQRGTADATIAPPAPRATASQLATASLAQLARLERALAEPDARAVADAQLGSVELVLATLRSLVGIAAALDEPGLAGGADERLRAAAHALAAWLGTTRDDDAHVALRALGGGAPAPEALEVSDPADPAEREAEHVADAVMRGESIAIGAHAPAARAHRTRDAASGADDGGVDPMQLMLAITALVAIIGAVVWKLLPQAPAAVPAQNAKPAATKPAAASSSSKSTPPPPNAKYEQQQVQIHRGQIAAQIAPLQQRLQDAATIDANIQLHPAHATITQWLQRASSLLAQTKKTQTQQAWWQLHSNNALPSDQALRQAVEALSIHVAIRNHGPRLTNARQPLAAVQPALQQYDAAHHNNRVQTTIAQIDAARASEAGLTAHTVAAYQTSATQIVAAATALSQRYQTAQPGLFVAAPPLGMPTVIAVIHEAFTANLGLAGAELALGFARANGLEAPLANLIANFQFRASLVREAQRQHATPAQLAALQNFQRLNIIAPNVQIQIPIIANETLSDARRTASLHWAHFLDPHCYAYATAAILRDRQDSTSLWPQGTTAAIVAQHMQTAVNAHPRLANLRAAIEHKANDPFDRKFVQVAPNLRVQIGTQVDNGTLRITQFFPIQAAGNGVDHHDLATTNLLGRLLAHRA